MSARVSLVRKKKDGKRVVPVESATKFSFSACYRRLLSGKKSLELHVRRAIECERLDDCHRACDYEKYFVCEGFNYR